MSASQVEPEFAVEFARRSEQERLRLEARSRGRRGSRLRRLGRQGGELLAGEVDGGSLAGDLGLQVGALAAAAKAAEAVELLLGGGEAARPSRARARTRGDAAPRRVPLPRSRPAACHHGVQTFRRKETVARAANSVLPAERSATDF